MLCCQLMTLEITLNTNQVKVNANKNIYLQNIKTDNIVTSIYKDTHDKKGKKVIFNIFTPMSIYKAFST